LLLFKKKNANFLQLSLDAGEFLAETWRQNMDALSLFGLFAVTAMLVCYALEDRDHFFILAFAVACALGSAYGFLQGAWPFGLVEAVWAVVALRRWSVRRPVNA
jgi:hypothetical protein